MRKTACIIIGSLVLAGCASAGRIGDLPKIADGADSATLVIIRPTHIVGMANSYYVALDGIDVFSIRSGENTHFPIPAGPHAIAVKCFGGWSPTWKEDAKSFIVEKSRSAYFSISPNMTCSEIVQVSETQAKALLEKTTFVDPSVNSNRDSRAPEPTGLGQGAQAREPSDRSGTASVPSSPIASSQCPIQLRHGVREPVCASQAITPPMAPSPAQVLPNAIVQAGAAPAVPAVPAILAVPAAPAATSSPSTAARIQTVTKVVGEQQITCRIPLPEYPGDAQQRHLTGSVTVRITIFPPHVVKQLTLIESSGDTSLDAAAIRAAEGTECSNTEQRFQLFQPFKFDL